jgi:hypothetical protein
MKPTVEEKIIYETLHWAKKLNINVNVVEYNKTKFAASVFWRTDYKDAFIALNLKYLIKQTPEFVVSSIFHELGHVYHKTKLYYTDKQKIKSENLAETYCLKQLKKYLPKIYAYKVNLFRECLVDKKWQYKYPLYVKAFSLISEYR